LLYDKWQSNVSLLTDWLKNLPKPVAIMACNDDFGIHIIEAANMAGTRIPEEVAILGVDNDEFICDLYDPPMSSIDQEPENVGFKVAQIVKGIIKDGIKSGDKIIGNNFRIVTRRSTDIFAIEDEQLVKALNYIKENASKRSISVAEVVSATTLSRRLLELRFRKLLNRSVLQEIKQIRIDAIVQKLTTTREPVSKIAYALGFNSLASFSNYFKNEKKISPGVFRKQFQIK
jgi:LacI family transcriptional regulator